MKHKIGALLIIGLLFAAACSEEVVGFDCKAAEADMLLKKNNMAEWVAKLTPAVANDPISMRSWQAELEQRKQRYIDATYN